MRGVLCLLKGTYPELACMEANAAMIGWRFWEEMVLPVDSTLFFANKRKIPTVLGLTHRIVKIIATCPSQDLESALSRIDWNIDGTYRVRLTKCVSASLRERDVARFVWTSLHDPRVDLENPDTTIEVVVTSERAYVGIRAWEDEDRWESRRADSWVAPHPTATHPTIARALVNLSCATRIHDPFCGAGGFLIEGSLAGYEMSGADSDPEMIVRARKNTRAMNLAPALTVADATARESLSKVQAIVTDMPYGKNTKTTNLSPLLEALLLVAKGKTQRIVLGCASPMKETFGWNIRANASCYVHKGMTRYYYILEDNT